MGGSASKEIGEVKFPGATKNVELYVEICGSWGFSGKASEVKSLISNLSKTTETNVTYTLDPKEGGKGEYFVSQVIDGTRNTIFSNNQKLHGESAIIGAHINSENSFLIIKKVQ